LPAPLLRSTAVSAPDRRKHRRADLAIAGRIMSEGGREQDCRTLDVSVGGARFAAPRGVPPQAGVVVYMDELGRMPGTVTRVAADGTFGVCFDISAHKREKLAEQLTWMLNKGLFAYDEQRRHPRKETAGAISVSLEDGTLIYCEVRDFSLVGCSLRGTRDRPPLGAWLRIGQTYGRVARYLEDGFAVDFQAPTRRAL
jgi:hypothetical protein